jgi:hypothetical protein
MIDFFVCHFLRRNLMKRNVMAWILAGLTLSLWACSTPSFQTLKILDTPDRAVALQVMPDAYGGRGYDHPVSITKEKMIEIMQGVRAEKRGLYSASSSRSSQLHPAFSPSEAQFFAPHIVKGLSRATPEEVVTFFETTEIETDDLEKDYQLTTSGGFYVAGGNLYVVLSNFSVKAPVWRDLLDAQAEEGSIRTRPLEQLEPQPGGLSFEPKKFMVVSPDGEIGSMLKGKPWQVAIRLKEFLETPGHVSESK